MTNEKESEMKKEQSYLVMIVSTEELTLQELEDYAKMPWVAVELDAQTQEAIIIKKQY